MLQAQERLFRLGVRLDEVERRAIDAAVEASGETLSEWVRNALARAAREARGAPKRATRPNPFVEAHERRNAARSAR